MTTITDAMLAHYNQLAARAEAETSLLARTEAAEDEVHRLGVRLAEWIERAHAANAEVDRLRAALEAAKADATEWEALWRQDAAGG